KKNAPVAEYAPPLVVRVLHPAEFFTRDTVDPVVLRQALVEEGVIRIVELQQATIRFDEILEEQLSLAHHRLGELCGKIRIVERLGQYLCDILQAQPLRRETGGQRFRPRILEQALDFPLKNGGICETTPGGHIKKLFIGRRRPKEERQPSREIHVV